MKKIGIVCIIIVVLVVLLINSSFSIVGKWTTQHDEDIEFFKNGTFVACSDFGEQGSYTYEDDCLVIMPSYDDPIVLNVKKINKNEIRCYEEDDEDDGFILYRVQ